MSYTQTRMIGWQIFASSKNMVLKIWMWITVLRQLDRKKITNVSIMLPGMPGHTRIVVGWLTKIDVSLAAVDDLYTHSGHFPMMSQREDRVLGICYHLTTFRTIRNWRDGWWKSGGTSGHISRYNQIFYCRKLMLTFNKLLENIIIWLHSSLFTSRLK